MHRLRTRRLFGASVLASTLAACGGGGGGLFNLFPSPPGQAASGPGGADYPYSSVVESDHGAGDTRYWIFEPGSPGTGSHPFVVFVHGYGALTPDPYRPWLEHLAKKGNVVVYPAYQSSLSTPPFDYTPNAAAAIRDAIAEIQGGGHATVDLLRAGVTGHSYGGVIAANLAAQHAQFALPGFLAVMCNAPGTGGWDTYADYSDIPSGTLLLTVVCEDDGTVLPTDAKRIFDQSTSVSLADKDFVTLRHDYHGVPPLSADHLAPASPVNAFDWRGFWKWFDALLDAAFYGTNRAFALGDTPQQRDLGQWSDGRDVEEPVVTDAP